MYLPDFICQVSETGQQMGGEQLLENVYSARAFFDPILRITDPEHLF